MVIWDREELRACQTRGNQAKFIDEQAPLSALAPIFGLLGGAFEFFQALKDTKNLLSSGFDLTNNP